MANTAPDLLRFWLAAHARRVQDAGAGKGFDRHLPVM